MCYFEDSVCTWAQINWHNYTSVILGLAIYPYRSWLHGDVIVVRSYLLMSGCFYNVLYCLPKRCVKPLKCTITCTCKHICRRGPRPGIANEILSAYSIWDKFSYQLNVYVSLCLPWSLVFAGIIYLKFFSSNVIRMELFTAAVYLVISNKTLVTIILQSITSVMIIHMIIILIPCYRCIFNYSQL